MNQHFTNIGVSQCLSRYEEGAQHIPAKAFVQYLYSICTVYVRFRSVHILYKYCTYTVHMTGNVYRNEP